MGKRRTRTASIAVAGVVVAGALLSTAGSGQAASSPSLFDPAPVSVVCGETSAQVTYHVDTARIVDPPPANSVVTLSSPVGTLGQSPSPFGDPDTGSAYWTVPYAELGVATVTWTRRDMSDGTFFSDGTFDVDLSSLCGHVATTTTEAPTVTTSDPTVTTTAPPVVPVSAAPASAVATDASLTG